MSSTANNSASNPSSTTCSAPNMATTDGSALTASHASSSSNCDPAAKAYTQITLPGDITIAVQPPNLVFTFDQPSFSSSEQQGRTVAPFVLRQLFASVNGNGNDNDNGAAVPNSAAAAAPASPSTSAENRSQPANEQQPTTTIIISSSNGLQSTATPTVVGVSTSSGGGSDRPSSFPAVTTSTTTPTSIGVPLSVTASSSSALAINTVRHPRPAHPINPIDHLPSSSRGLNSPFSPSSLDAGQMRAAFVKAYSRLSFLPEGWVSQGVQNAARNAAALQALQTTQQELRQKANAMQNN